MKYFYASRHDKNGNYLVTSYNNATTRNKYGGTESKTFDGLRGVELDELGQAQFNDKGEGHVVRSYMRASERKTRPPVVGKFVLYAQNDEDVWQETDYVSDQYGDLNKIMKDVACEFKAVMIIERDVDTSSGPTFSDEAPF